jgi:ribose transport system ATP-binding protein
LRLLILDEPTSSLGAREAGQLRSYVARRRADGVSFVFISHRLQETLDFTDRIVVLQNGSVAWSGSTSDVSEAELVRLMGGGPASAGAAAPPRTAAAPGDDRPLVDVTALTHGPLTDVSIRVGRGEIVGLGGLEGSGQRQLLHEVYAAQERRDGPVRIGGRVAFVSGDRANEGILPLWEIRRNISLASVGTLTRSGVISPADERELSQTWYDRLAVRAASVDAPIMSLSGGNQQKAVIARAMASQADVIALDDPTRGVDLATKAELYRLFRGLADDGRAILWYSTDSVEFDECDRVYVMRDGHVTQELAKQEISAESIVEASFKPAGDTPGDETGRVRSRESRLRSRERLSAFIPLIALLAVLAACYAKNPDILTRFGVELTFSAAIPLSFAAAAQLFVITAGDIDLGLGYFMGLVNVIAATWLVDEPALAAAALVPLVLAYPLVGYFIHRRQVPAIIVTLGLSFVWLGFAAYRLSSPGGSAPDWLSGALDHELPVVPEAVYIVVFPGLVAYFVLHVWRYGAVLRGFGNNPRAIDAAGWSTASARVILYALAGAFAFLAGMMVTGNTLGGDPTGSASYTLLSVAAVILGGARFSGGVVAPIGSVFAVLTLILVGTMLSLLDVPNEYLAMVQGVLLLSVVGIRTVLTRSEL